jgi:hypothetical protein
MKSIKKTISLKDFVKTGIFGPINLGSTKDELVDFLGDKFIEGDFDQTQIFAYGAFEFYIWAETNILWGIQNDHLQADCSNHAYMISWKNKKFKFDPWFLQVGKNVTFGEIKNILTTENIDFTIENSSAANENKVIKCVDSKVTFDFCLDFTHIELDEKGNFLNEKTVIETNQEHFILNGIRLFDIEMIGKKQ